MGKKSAQARKKVAQPKPLTKQINEAVTMSETQMQQVAAKIVGQSMATLSQILNAELQKTNNKVQILFERVLGVEQYISDKYNLTTHDLFTASHVKQMASVGGVESEAPAEKGDYVVLQLSAKTEDEPTFEEKHAVSRYVYSLGSEPYELREEHHEQLIGMTPGQTKTYNTTITQEDGEELTVNCKLVLTKVYKLPQPEVTEPVAENNTEETTDEN